MNALRTGCISTTSIEGSLRLGAYDKPMLRATLLRLQEIELRQAALAVARLEAGQRAWLARQQRAWRRRALLHEQVLLLALAGANLELYDAASWRQMAHEVAAYLMGSQIEPVGLL